MEWLILLSLLALGAILLGRRRSFSAPKTRPVSPQTLQAFTARPSLFVNRAEHTFFAMLDKALPPSMHLLTKVRLEDIIAVKADIRGEAKWKLRARVKSRHVDYLIIDRAGRPLLAIELDGDSHDATTQTADELKDGLFQTVGIPLKRVRVGDDFHSTIRTIVRDLSAA